MKKEIWKDIEGYEDYYQISNFGNIKSFYGGRSGTNKSLGKKDGYNQVGLIKNKKRACFYVHRLVAQAFIENPHKSLS